MFLAESCVVTRPRDHFPAADRARRDALVGDVIPLRRVARVQVPEPSGDVGVLTDRAGRGVEPHPVALDGPTHREAGIPVLDDLGRAGNAVRLQLVVDVVGLRPGPGQVAEVGAAERVAAGLGNDVELRPAAVGLAEPAGHGELHFLGVGGVVAVAGHAAAVEGRADVHAVDLHGALVAAAAARREEDHPRVDAAVLRAVGLNAGGDRQQVPVSARRRQRRQDFVAQHRLDARAVLHVHHRCFAHDGDRFLQAAHAQLGVERQGDAGLEFHFGALHGREAGERVGNGVDSRDQAIQAKLARAVGHRRADLFDQRGAGGFDGDARQHGSRGVAHDTRDRLCRRQRRHDCDDHSSERQPDRGGGKTVITHPHPPRTPRIHEARLVKCYRGQKWPICYHRAGSARANDCRVSPSGFGLLVLRASPWDV